jgi:cytochrome c-type biogenesis protein CcmH
MSMVACPQALPIKIDIIRGNKVHYFWIIIILLTILALVFVLRPLLRPNPSYPLALFLLIFVPALASVIYLRLGNSEAVTKWLALENGKDSLKQELAKFGSRQNVIYALHQKLMSLPKSSESAKGWYILGKLYFNENNIDEAIRSFHQAMELKPQEQEYILQFVTADFYKNKFLSQEDKQILQHLLKLSPKNINAINLLALDAFQSKHFSEAIYHWETLLQFFPAESEDSRNLLAMIQEAQKQLPLKENTAPRTTLEVTINCAPEMKVSGTENAVLYVYALEAGGSKMPLAVQRLINYRFPVKIILDSSQSMIPGRSLTNAKKVYIQARLSRSGNAISQKGDKIGSSEVFTLLKYQSIVVTINKIL